MSTIKKPDYTIFAKDAKSDELQPFPNISRGWGITLEQTAGMPPLEWANYIQKRTDEWLMYLTQRGVAEWDSSLDYPKSAVVTHGDVIYISLRASKGEQPNTTQAAWSQLGAFLGLGNYATNEALNNGLALKFDKAGGTITGDVTFSKNAIKSTNGTHTLPDKTGTLMQVGDYGWGGSVGGRYSMTEDDFTAFITDANNPTQVFRNSVETKYSQENAAVAHFRAGNLSCSISAGFGTAKKITVTGGDARIENINVYELYHDLNTTKDSNGFLRTGSATALTTGQVVQTTGQSTTNVMSQKAVTDLIVSMAIGIGQTWQDMSGSREKLTNYTNTTGRPIAVYIKFTGGESTVEGAIKVDGITVGFASGNNAGMSNTTIVPPGSVYRVNTDRVVTTWSELR